MEKVGFEEEYEEKETRAVSLSFQAQRTFENVAHSAISCFQSCATFITLSHMYPAGWSLSFHA